MQTTLTQGIASYLSGQLKAKVTVNAVDVDLFKTLVLEGVFVEDLHRDTLIYIEKLKADIAIFNFKQDTISFRKIVLENLFFDLKIYKNEESTNLKFIINALTSTDTTASQSKLKIDFQRIEIVNSQFKYREENYPQTPFGINFDDINLTNLNIIINDLNFLGDTVYGDFELMSFKDKSGFELLEFSSPTSYSDKKLYCEKLHIKTPFSDIFTRISMDYNTITDMTDFNNLVRMKSLFQPSIVSFIDIAYYATYLKGINNVANLSGEIYGTVNKLHGKNLEIAFGETSVLKGNVDIDGLPEIEETYIHYKIKELSTNKKDMELIPLYPFDSAEHLELPNELNLLGQIRFKGNFSGFINDFVTYGAFTTSLGKLSSDLELKFDTAWEHPVYKGFITTNNFNAGKFFGVKELGQVSLNATIDAKEFAFDKLDALLQAEINDIDFNNYRYQNIEIRTEIAKKIIIGSLAIKDKNLDFDLAGKINFKEKIPEFKIVSHINNARIVPLNMINRDTSFALDSEVIMDFTGNNFDNLSGTIDIQNLFLKEKNKEFKIKYITLNSSQIKESKTLKISSDLGDAEIKGEFNIAELPSSVSHQIDFLIFQNTNEHGQNKANIIESFTYNIHIKNINPVTELFLDGINFAPNTTFYGSFNSTNENFELKGTSPKINLYGSTLKNYFIDLKGEKHKFEIATGSDKFMLSDSIWVNNFRIKSKTNHDTVNFFINWNDSSSLKNQADINGSVVFNSFSKFKININPSPIYIADTLWLTGLNNEIDFDTTSIFIKNFSFSTQSQSIAVRGKISENPQEQLKILFHEFNLGNLNRMTVRNGISLKGFVDGDAIFSSIYANTVFVSNLKMNTFNINGELLGNGSLDAVWNTKNEAIELNTKFFRGNIPTIALAGFYYPNREKENLDLTLKVEKLQLKMFDNYVYEYIADLRGLATGSVTIKGEPNKPLLNGKINLQKTGFLFSYLNTSYSFSDEIRITDHSFDFENITVYDAKGNTATVAGSVRHTNFENFKIRVDMETPKFYCLNTNENQNPMYYGQGYMSGKINVSGTVDNLVIDIVGKSEKGTQFNIPLTGTEDITENNFITFVKKNKDTLSSKDAYKVDMSGITMNFEMEITPDAEMQLIFDPKIGDIMKGRGNGNLKLEITTLGKFNIFGEFVVDNGEYLFTLLNIINKEFKVEKGGTVRWNGDPYHADLNISTIYPTKTTLKPLGFDTTGKRVPVNCVLKMSNDLMSPDIKFDITMPNSSDEAAKTQLKTLIANEEELNRQVFALMTLGGFVTPQTQTGSNTNVAVNTGKSTGSELLSSQLSNWLSQISDDFDLGVKYRAGDEVSSKQVEVALSTQLFNERLTIDGNVGMAGSQGTPTPTSSGNSTLVGDFNVEYKLTDDGKLRMKAFGKANDGNFANVNSPYTQGAGIAYRKEFDTFGELYKSIFKKRKEKKKE